MLISYNWLKQFIKLDWEPVKVGELLTNLGLELEGISEFESVKGSLEGVVVGEVLSVDKHPNADKLTLCKVDLGNGDPVQIVCGAPNVAAGQKVPVATIGTTLYTPEGESWKIKKGKIRGEESHGMICAEDELGLGDSHDGIMVLDPSTKSGTACSDLFELEYDHVFNIDLTPNRADAMSHYGVARDLKAGLKRHEINLELLTPSISKFSVDNRSRKIDVVVEDSAMAPRYCGVTISDIIVQSSPDWLKNRLRAIGLSPINNVVDATNYVLHELGQPLHAFDADRIYGNKVVVKTVEAGTKFVTLDGEERTLDVEDLMICDAEKPMCIGGVFGGINTGVTEDTKAIFLESAYFDPISIRKTAKRHGLSTDASFRFERGIDITTVDYALQRAAMLGAFYSGNHAKELFTAKRNEAFELPDPNELTYLKEGYDRIEFEFPDEEGNLISLQDPQFQDKAVLIQIMGTWCPNCLDESRFLSNYLSTRNYEDLAVVALAFEYATNEEKAFRGIRRLKDRLGINYPILLAQVGTSSKAKANEKLPMLNHVLSYPTTIFLDKEGEVRNIHTGFNGPATGEPYEEFKREFDSIVQVLRSE